MTLLACDDIEVRYGAVVALRGVSLSVAPGEAVGLIGGSGSGKSTLARVLLGLVRPDRGVVRHAGRSLDLRDRASVAALRRAVQPVFQDPSASLDPRFSALDCVVEPLVLRGDSRVAARSRAASLLERVGLSAELHARLPHQLSGGQRQRVAIARALAPEPALLVLDEPVSALDVSVQAQVLNLLRSLGRELGTAYLFIAHDLPAVDFLCSRTLVMHEGRIVEILARGGFDRAEHAVSKALVSSVPSLPSHPAAVAPGADRA